MTGTSVVRKESIEEICGHRERALELYQRVVTTFEEATKAHVEACKLKGGYATTPELKPSRDRGYYRGTEEFMEQIRLQIDRDMWRGFINGTPIGSLMDKKEREEFEKALNDNPPPVTPDNVQATLERLFGDADMIFRRGLVNAFTRLNREYASNDGFKLGERIVLTWGVSWCKISKWFTLHSSRDSELQDVDRVMHVLDGKPAPEYQQGLCAALRTLCYSGGRDKGTEVTTEYWRARIFKNGNIHLWPLRKDLLDRANKIIAEHFGEVVAAGTAAHKATAEPAEPVLNPDVSRKADYFPTPEPVVQRLMELAEIEGHMKVLEPSAGEGAIAYAMRKITSDVWCCELRPTRVQKLRDDGFICQEGDFLQLMGDRRFDTVVMNPPFSGNQAVAHILHATKFLKPGGRLVAVMPANTHKQDNKWGEALRKLIRMMNGTYEELPEGAFKESGTMVRTAILTLDMPNT